MILEQFYLGCLAHASYLIGSEGTAAVVDPQRDVDLYVDAAARLGLKISLRMLPAAQVRKLQEQGATVSVRNISNPTKCGDSLQQEMADCLKLLLGGDDRPAYDRAANGAPAAESFIDLSCQLRLVLDGTAAH